MSEGIESQSDGGKSIRFWRTLRKAFSQFLAIPTWIIFGFLALAAFAYGLDHGRVEFLEDARGFLRDELLRDPEATKALLAAIATGLLTVTGLTFALVLLALQQSAASMTSQVIDQFLRRRENQYYFGFFVGLVLYSLVSLALAAPEVNSVFAAMFGLILTLAGVYLLIILAYTAINQIRPPVVVDGIHAQTLKAYGRHTEMLSRTRRQAQFEGATRLTVISEVDGYVTDVRLDRLEAAITNASGPVEIDLQATIGTYVAFHDPMAEIKATHSDDCLLLREPVLEAIALENQRNLDRDPTYGVDQLSIIAWTAVSTAKSNPGQGILVIHSLRDLLARWSSAKLPDSAKNHLPVVYADNAMSTLMDTFESLTVVASESMQHQTYAELLRTFALLLPRLGTAEQERAGDIVMRSLSALGEHVLTAQLEDALDAVISSFEAEGRDNVAGHVRRALGQLRLSIGELNARSTRVPSA